MSPTTYNALTYLMLGGSLIALVFAVGFLVTATVGWRGPNRKRRLIRFAILLGLFPALVVAHQALLWGVFLPSLGREFERKRMDRTEAVSRVHVGDSAPSFTLTDTNGGVFDIQAQHGRVVLVNFFATWCGPCLNELPHLQDLWGEHRSNDDFAMILVGGRNENNETLAAFRTKHNYSLPMASDPSGTTYSLYAEKLIPRTYLVAPNGTICFTSTGFYDVDMAELKKELAKQLRSVR